MTHYAYSPKDKPDVIEQCNYGGGLIKFYGWFYVPDGGRGPMAYIEFNDENTVAIFKIKWK